MRTTMQTPQKPRRPVVGILSIVLFAAAFVAGGMLVLLGDSMGIGGFGPDPTGPLIVLAGLLVGGGLATVGAIVGLVGLKTDRGATRVAAVGAALNACVLLGAAGYFVQMMTF